MAISPHQLIFSFAYVSSNTKYYQIYRTLGDATDISLTKETAQPTVVFSPFPQDKQKKVTFILKLKTSIVMKNIAKNFQNFRQKAEDALYVDSHIECKNCFPGWRWEATISVLRESEGQKEVLEVYRKTSAKWFTSEDKISDSEFFAITDWAMRLERDLEIDINLGAYNS